MFDAKKKNVNVDMSNPDGIQHAKELGPDKDIVINMSGRGDKDMPQVAKIMGGNWLRFFSESFAPN